MPPVFKFTVKTLVLVCISLSLTRVFSTSSNYTTSIEPSNRASRRLLDALLAPAGGVGEGKQFNQSTFYHVQVTAIYIDKSEFPLSKLLFRLTLKLALEEAQKRLKLRGVKLSLSIRSANTCSRQYAGAVAAEEYYTKRSRLFLVSGCDDAIRAVSRLASGWQVPVMTAAGFGADLNDKSVHKTLVRVAFSLGTAVEFLIKILRSFQWQRVNLIVDESDANSAGMKESIEKHFADYSLKDFRVKLNVIPLDLKLLFNMSNGTMNATNTFNMNSENNSTSLKLFASAAHKNEQSLEDKWPNEFAERAVASALRQSSLFSRVNVLLIPQQHLRRFMLSVHDQSMANGLYAFINMPLLFYTNEELENEADVTLGGSSRDSATKQGYAISTGENVFIWRSLASSRNAQAKQAFESLMSVFLRTPTNKFYVYFASKLSNLANTEFTATTTTRQASYTTKNSKESSSRGSSQASNKIQLSINPYSAAFYDCLQIYSIVLDESLGAIRKETNKDVRRQLKAELHGRISDLMRNRRYENMVTGTIFINNNGDRETDYTLDDLNQMTGRFAPVIVFKGDTKGIERVARIHWSSNDTVGPTVDSVDCQLVGNCPSKPLSRFLITLLLATIPLALTMASVLYLVYGRLKLESQLVDYWWKIKIKEIEIISTRRKKAGDGSSGPGSQVSHSRTHNEGSLSEASAVEKEKSSITKATETSAAFASSAADVCYGNVSLGIYKLAKCALKPIGKFHQTRKLVMELRAIKGINHSNLCRFVGIVVDEAHTALVSEFCPKGSLREFFQNESMVIDWTFKFSIINDIIAGLLYLHSSPLEFHGRLKSSNCLVSSRFVVKLSDYGLGSLHEQMDADTDNYLLMRKQIWLAPEQLTKSCGSKGGSKKADVYSFGLLLYEIITNNLPFYDEEKNDFVMPLKALLEELKCNGISLNKTGPNLNALEITQGGHLSELVNLVKQCWRYNPDKRPSSLVVSTALKGITRGVTSKKLLENLTGRMEQYTNNLESLIDAKLATLLEEKLKTEELLYQFVPKSIASLLKEGQSVEPEAFECVTVFYSDIVGFTSLSSESSPMEVIDFLSDLYQCFDETLEQYDIFKVDTIGDAYIVASGLPERNGGKHVIEIARAALELRERLNSFKIPHKPGRSLQMRVGIHSGPCIAGIVGGLSMPKYCVFGDTISTGKFMESNGLPMKIHITEESKNLLEAVGGFKLELRVPKINKDGLPYQTYWLENE